MKRYTGTWTRLEDGRVRCELSPQVRSRSGDSGNDPLTNVLAEILIAPYVRPIKVDIWRETDTVRISVGNQVLDAGAIRRPNGSLAIASSDGRACIVLERGNRCHASLDPSIIS